MAGIAFSQDIEATLSRGCSDPDCDHDHLHEAYLTPICHTSAGLRVDYAPVPPGVPCPAVLRLRCRRCTRLVASLAVTAPLPLTPACRHGRAVDVCYSAGMVTVECRTCQTPYVTLTVLPHPQAQAGPPPSQAGPGPIQPHLHPHHHGAEDGVEYICADCAPRPDPRYATLDPQRFIGRFVKRGFPVLRSPVMAGTEHLPAIEHMWCKVVRVNPDGTLQARLFSEPQFPVGYRYRAWVQVALHEIEAVEPAFADA
jgi:hypothetical protein